MKLTLNGDLSITIFNIYGSRNVGDGALLNSLLLLLSTQGILPTEISLVCLDPDDEKSFHHPTYNFFARICNKRDFRNSLIFYASIAFGFLYATTGHFRYLFESTLPPKHLQTMHLFSRSNVSISCPGGYLEDSNSSYILNILQILLACRLSNYVILAPQSIGPIKSNFGRFLLSIALNRVNATFVREPWSFQFLHNLRPRVNLSKCSISGDIAFLLPTAKSDRSETLQMQLDLPKCRWGLTLVDWNFPSAHNPKLERQKYLSAVSQTCLYLETYFGTKGLILNQVTADSRICKDLVSLSDSVLFVDTLLSYDQMTSLISSFDFFLGTRFHSCIFAAQTRTPFISINYLPKSSGILDQLGLSDVGIDICECENGLLPLVKYHLAFLDLLSVRINSAVNNYCNLNLSGFVNTFRTVISC